MALVAHLLGQRHARHLSLELLHSLEGLLRTVRTIKPRFVCQLLLRTTFYSLGFLGRLTGAAVKVHYRCAQLNHLGR